MQGKGSLIVGLGIVVGSIILSLSGKAAPTPTGDGKATPAAIGRYQFGSGPAYVYVIDTTTGQVWSHNAHSSLTLEEGFFEPKNSLPPAPKRP